MFGDDFLQNDISKMSPSLQPGSFLSQIEKSTRVILHTIISFVNCIPHLQSFRKFHGYLIIFQSNKTNPSQYTMYTQTDQNDKNDFNKDIFAGQLLIGGKYVEKHVNADSLHSMANYMDKFFT